MTQRPLTELELHAYLDGELEPSRRKEIARAVQADPRLASTLAAYAADGERMRRALASAAAAPLGAGWIDTIERGMRPTRFRTGRRAAIVGGLAAAACAAIVVSTRQPAQGSLLASAERARDVVTGNMQAISPYDDQLRARTGLRVRAPNLDHFGFRLATLRLLGPAGHGSAQISYLDGQHRLLTIYVRPSDGQVRFDLLRRGDLRVCVWQDDVVGAVIMAPMRAGEMLRIASSAYADLNL